jgi:hypothetical protein
MSGERMLLTPVRLLPGRLRLATRPDSTGSMLLKNLPMGAT